MGARLWSHHEQVKQSGQRIDGRVAHHSCQSGHLLQAWGILTVHEGIQGEVVTASIATALLSEPPNSSNRDVKSSFQVAQLSGQGVQHVTIRQ